MDESDVPELIFDVGAHMGEDSDFYLKLGYRVVAVEANPVLADHLRARFAEEMKQGRFILVDKAVGRTAGTITFYVNKDVSVWGTADPEWARRNERMGARSEQVQVECVEFSELVRQYGCPDYLKVDIEGADMLCIEALAESEERPRFVSVESTKTSWRRLKREFDTLRTLGYTKFKIVDQQRHVGRHFMTLDGGMIVHDFPEGATGAFGRHLDGRWLTRRQALLRYVPIFLAYATIGDNTPLPRVLRRVPLVRRVLGAVSWYDTHATRD